LQSGIAGLGLRENARMEEVSCRHGRTFQRRGGRPDARKTHKKKKKKKKPPPGSNRSLGKPAISNELNIAGGRGGGTEKGNTLPGGKDEFQIHNSPSSPWKRQRG